MKINAEQLAGAQDPIELTIGGRTLVIPKLTGEMIQSVTAIATQLQSDAKGDRAVNIAPYYADALSIFTGESPSSFLDLDVRVLRITVEKLMTMATSSSESPALAKN